MTGASKILTVSYGTFSCTLEGFDDPFNTMKAIAEYFRDLAAEDRYFGAEPPTPDAAMLHRIAEREIQRRVEAKVQENGIVLRASDGNPPPVAADTTPAPKTETAPAAPQLMEALPQSAETVAEKLSRLRAEVTAQPPSPATHAASLALPAAAAYSVPEFEAPDFGEDEDYDLPAAAATDFAGEDRLAIDADAVADTLPEDRPDPVADLPEDVAPEAEAPWDSELLALAPAAADAEAETPEAMDVAAAPLVSPDATDALLSSLMADLTAKAVSPAMPDPAPAPASASSDEGASDGPVAEKTAAIDMDGTEEDTAAGSWTSAASIDLPEVDDASESWAAEEDTAESPEAPAVPAGDEADAAALAAEESIFADEEMQAPAAEPAPAETDAAFSLFSAEDADDLQTAAALADPAPARGSEGQPVPEFAEPDADEAAETAADLRPDASEKLMRARARVIRIRRSDTAAEVPTPAEQPAPAAILSPEAEADLAAELAALSAVPDDQSEGEGDDDGAEAIAPADDAPAAGPSLAPTEAGRRAFDEAAADATISRLMAQADEQLEGPESKRRLSAIAHLKAAVAATVAERRATGDKPKDSEPSQLSRYRDDLAKVVRNKLGGASGPAERLAPLVLVSEQRIDRPRPVATSQPAAAAPAPQTAAPSGTSVVPRRIAGSANLAFAQDEDEIEDFALDIGDSRGFTEFADRLGAKSLGELLEASAAYLACVEGREHFTRPQLMGLVQAALPDGDIPREDGLRSFGTLLRSGRIEKIRRGQFALSEQSTYLAEGRRIAG